MMSDDRFVVALAHFEKSLDRLHESLERPEDDFMRDSVIQRFEFTFEAAWKAMYRWLRARGNDVDEEAFEVIPKAFKLRLIADEKGWGNMRKFRNLSSHTYDEEVAIKVAAFVRVNGIGLLDTLFTTLRERSR